MARAGATIRLVLKTFTGNIMAHRCTAIVVHCMDYRLQSYINQWLEANLAQGSYDRAVMAGGVFDVYDVIRQVDISDRLHGITTVILINHEDCGMYGIGGTEQHHERDLEQAEDKIRRLFPHLEVDTYYLNLDGTFEKKS
ncbi:MAG: carbonic anhydrase [Pseudomonadota bacterium]